MSAVIKFITSRDPAELEIFSRNLFRFVYIGTYLRRSPWRF
jgi:hypothetical protein